MHVNARAHTAAVVQNYLFEDGISIMEWPGRNPDMNSIEHLCNPRRMGEHSPSRGRNSQTIDEKSNGSSHKTAGSCNWQLSILSIQISTHINT